MLTTVQTESDKTKSTVSDEETKKGNFPCHDHELEPSRVMNPNKHWVFFVCLLVVCMCPWPKSLIMTLK